MIRLAKKQYLLKKRFVTKQASAQKVRQYNHFGKYPLLLKRETIVVRGELVTLFRYAFIVAVYRQKKSICRSRWFLPSRTKKSTLVILLRFLTLQATFFIRRKKGVNLRLKQIFQSYIYIFIMKNLIAAAFSAFFIVFSISLFASSSDDKKAASEKTSCSTSCCSKSMASTQTASTEKVAKTDGECCPTGPGCCASACSGSDRKVAAKTTTTAPSAKVTSVSSKSAE